VDLSRPLGVLTPTVDGDVLAALARAEAAFTPGQLHRLLGRHSEAGVRKCLARLVEQGIVRAERAGNAYLYSLNRAHLAAGCVQELARLRDVLLQRLSQRFATWPIPPVYAALFGSAARGDMNARSDIDLFVVRPTGTSPDEQEWRSAAETLTREVTDWTGNDTRILEFSRSETLAALASRDPVIEDIRAEGLPLHGDPRLLRRHRKDVRAPH
jgi:predicted nucleotidyltransferase